LKLSFSRVAICACLVAGASPAGAQIYSWTDGNGHLVLSNRPKGGGEHAYVVPQSESIRATRPVDTSKSTLYDEMIRVNARLHGVRTDLVRAVVQVESAFNPWAKSPKGAMGLMQLMPETMKEFGVRNAFDPGENIRGGVAYLKQLLDRYKNNEVLALAAYNAGPGAVDKHGQTVPPYRETQDYVKKINSISAQPIQMRGSSTVIYKITEIVDGRETIRYSDQKPSTGAAYQPIGH
jgi:soluble lytic murein transglycosylase-like protein